MADPQTKVFLSYSWNDEDRVREVHKRLTGDHINCWVDKIDLEAGQNWESEIEEVIEKCHHFVAFLSHSSVASSGYVSVEMEKALDVADRQPAGSIFVIPVRLEDCPIPDRLSSLHWVDLFAKDGYSRLLAVLRSNPDRLKRTLFKREWKS